MLALTAPAVEIAFFTLKEEKTEAEIAPDLDMLTGLPTKAVISSTWGSSVEKTMCLLCLSASAGSLEASISIVCAPDKLSMNILVFS
ncbi:hypothetical protein EW145_g2626 [Phellinidium pouzarii]|uniref:Uncharacterized protein n=1 Tax=Phellinidium pouzarii TaxID=167371 RepID=A0A4S4LAB1_9AGAM|nr:hypothetical protein EW145_g2626 [Phellinidium pouzarii]